MAGPGPSCRRLHGSPRSADETAYRSQGLAWGEQGGSQGWAARTPVRQRRGRGSTQTGSRADSQLASIPSTLRAVLARLSARRLWRSNDLRVRNDQPCRQTKGELGGDEPRPIDQTVHQWIKHVHGMRKPTRSRAMVPTTPPHRIGPPGRAGSNKPNSRPTIRQVMP